MSFGNSPTAKGEDEKPYIKQRIEMDVGLECRNWSDLAARRSLEELNIGEGYS
jgi:hypothetical protein